MTKNLKLKIKNAQLTKAAGLDKLKKKLAQAGSLDPKSSNEKISSKEKILKKGVSSTPSVSEPASDSSHRRIRAKNRSSFINEDLGVILPSSAELEEEKIVPEVQETTSSVDQETEVELNEQIEESTVIISKEIESSTSSTTIDKEQEVEQFMEAHSFDTSNEEVKQSEIAIEETSQPIEKIVSQEVEKEKVEVKVNSTSLKPESKSVVSIKTKFGPTGKHINHLLANAYKTNKQAAQQTSEKKTSGKDVNNKTASSHKVTSSQNKGDQNHYNNKESSPDTKTQSSGTNNNRSSNTPHRKDVGNKKTGSDFKDRSKKFDDNVKAFTGRDRYGLNDGSDEDKWRKKRVQKTKKHYEEYTIQRPTHIKVSLPITVKDLAAEMKLKASELIQKLFIHGMTYVVNDVLDNETTVQFLGLEFGCTIDIDYSEKDKLFLTKNTVQEEILETDPSLLVPRYPIVAFMGHVDHGKTTLIDALRKSNRVATEAGAITQHMGAFKCSTPVGDITILDTPGHEAFSAMRARGADVCDIVVLVVAGDEGIKEQTIEAVEHARAANITIVVAINKSDKPNFNADTIYRQLSEINLLPEAWGGTIATVNTSAKTGEGISELLEMLSLQAEVLELKAAPSARARGIVIESELHKGLGFVATVLVQNGTLHLGDALVFDHCFGKVKTMHDEHNQMMDQALPSSPALITGLSAMPKAGDSFIVVKNEKIAKEIIEARLAGAQKLAAQKKRPNFDAVLQNKKTLKLIIKADVQGSIEALANSILNIISEKVSVDILSYGVGEVSESDIRLAAASKAVIIGFHTNIENHAESLIKSLGVRVELFDVIYHAIDNIKEMMTNLLDPIAEERNLGSAEIKETFKSSHLGTIYGCLVTEGIMTRNQKVRVVRGDEVLWKGSLSSLKRLKDDVKEVRKGLECGILLEGYQNAQRGDVLQCFEVIYHPQKL